MTANDVRKALRSRYGDRRRYAVIEEVGLTTGGQTRRLDMVVFDCYASNQFRIDGIEIKVSKEDLRRELMDPEKHVAFFDNIDFFTLACPKEVVAGMKDVIPPKWGIMIIGEDGRTKYQRKPLALRDQISKTTSRGFFASCIRAVLEHEPARAELRAEYERGRKDQEESYKHQMDYQRSYVKENYKRLETLNEIERRFSLWGDDLQALDDFEAFRKIYPSTIVGNIRSAVKSLKELEGYLTRKEGTVE